LFNCFKLSLLLLIIIELFPEVEFPERLKKTAAVSLEETSEEKQLTYSQMILLQKVQKKLHNLKPVPEEMIDEVLRAIELAECPGLFFSLINFGIGN
jgi:hypothetical protein